eukprot:TRINITY_DN3013_c0_g1_i1.p1 TRINITY_DN3013_c0_g1~~TRINITY_DN3013_c0_g1_i1.p1  ORF type:complete len:291 (-),score=63.67 TRINITY_DN3013_c0_g1_i1:37-909(-)
MESVLLPSIVTVMFFLASFAIERFVKSSSGALRACLASVGRVGAKWNNRAFGIFSGLMFAAACVHVFGLGELNVVRHPGAFESEHQCFLMQDTRHGSQHDDAASVGSRERHWDVGFGFVWDHLAHLRSGSVVDWTREDVGGALMGVFLLSKLWEFVDIVCVALMGVPLGWHFRIHHATTYSLVWTSLVAMAGFGAWPMFLANTLHHFFLYLYFGGIQLFGAVLPVTGTLQLVLGLAVGVLALWRRFAGGFDCTPSLAGEVYCFVMHAVFFVLWLHELRHRGEKPKGSKAD